MKSPKRGHQNSFNNKRRDLISHIIEDNLTEGESTNNSRLSFFELMLKLIVYFQPLDTKLQTTSKSNSKIKVLYIILKKNNANKFLEKIFINQVEDFLTTQIRNRLLSHFKIIEELRDIVDYI